MKIYTKALFLCGGICIGVAFLVIWYSNRKCDDHQVSHSSFLDKLYTRTELDKIFESAINEYEVENYFGQPSYKAIDNLEDPKEYTENTVRYFYIYHENILKLSNRSGNGIGFSVTFKNSKLQDWDIEGLENYSKIYSNKELDKTIYHGMPLDKVEKIFASPRKIYREGNEKTLYYIYSEDEMVEKDGYYDVGMFILLKDNKVINWGVINSSSKQFMKIFL